jgi:hypothetical protein
MTEPSSDPETERTNEPAPESIAAAAGSVVPALRPTDRWWPGLTALACAALLAVTAYAGSWALGAAALVIAGVMAWGWPTLLELPAPRSTTAALGISAVLADVAVAATRDDPLLDWLALAAAGGVIVCFLHQLTRRDGRPRLVESLSGELMAVALIACGAAVVGLPRTKGGADAVLTLAAAVAAVALVQLVPLPERLMMLPAFVASTAAGALAAGLVPDVRIAFGAVVGLAYAVAVAFLRRLFSARPVLAFLPAALALAAAPIAASGIATYVLARLLVG